MSLTNDFRSCPGDAGVLSSAEDVVGYHRHSALRGRTRYAGPDAQCHRFKL